MPSEFRDGNAAQAAPVYTVYTVPGGHGGNSDYGLHQSNPYAPPPKYEDVISGEYLKSYEQNCDQVSLPTHPRPDATWHCTCSHSNLITSQAMPTPFLQQDHEVNICKSIKPILLAFILVAIFLWSVSKMFL